MNQHSPERQEEYIDPPIFNRRGDSSETCEECAAKKRRAERTAQEVASPNRDLGPAYYRFDRMQAVTSIVSNLFMAAAIVSLTVHFAASLKTMQENFTASLKTMQEKSVETTTAQGKTQNDLVNAFLEKEKDGRLSKDEIDELKTQVAELRLEQRLNQLPQLTPVRRNKIDNAVDATIAKAGDEKTKSALRVLKQHVPNANRLDLDAEARQVRDSADVPTQKLIDQNILPQLEAGD